MNTKKNSIEQIPRYVDMWAVSSLHPTNIDLIQRLKSADDRQFGTNMDVCGRISTRSAKNPTLTPSHIIGIRQDIWNPDQYEKAKILRSLQKERREQLRQQIKKSGRLNTQEKNDLEEQISNDPVMATDTASIEQRRLVLKMFKTTGERIRWIGTIEEITSREVHYSLGSHRAVISLVVILDNYKYIIPVVQTHRTFRIPAVFTFALYNEDTKQMEYFAIKRKWVSIGADFTIECGNRKVGEIDGKLIGLGYNADLIINDPVLRENRQFMDLITLFAASVGYHAAMRRSIKRRMHNALSQGNFKHIIEREELWLLKNPRIKE